MGPLWAYSRKASAKLRQNFETTNHFVYFFIIPLKNGEKARGAAGEPAAPLRVVLPGLEPGNAAPKTVVLPLHYRTILTS